MNISALETQFFSAQKGYSQSRQALSAEIAKTGLTPEQWQVLRIIGSKGKTDCRGIASETPILGPSISRILNKLEDRRLICWTIDSSDCRRKILSLTAAGKRLVASI